MRSKILQAKQNQVILDKTVILSLVQSLSEY